MTYVVVVVVVVVMGVRVDKIVGSSISRVLIPHLFYQL